MPNRFAVDIHYLAGRTGHRISIHMTGMACTQFRMTLYTWYVHLWSQGHDLSHPWYTIVPLVQNGCISNNQLPFKYSQFPLQGGPLSVINRVITPTSRIITPGPVTHSIYFRAFVGGPVTPLITGDGAHLVSSRRFRGVCLDVRLPCHGQLGGECRRWSECFLGKTQPQKMTWRKNMQKPRLKKLDPILLSSGQVGDMALLCVSPRGWSYPTSKMFPKSLALPNMEPCHA